MPTQDDLRQWYIVDGLSLRQVAEKAGVSTSTIRYYMRRYKIPCRTKSEALAGERNPMHGKRHTEEARQQIAATTKRVFSAPEKRAARSERAQGDRNPMFGRTHTPEVKEASKQRLAVTRSSVAFQEAHQAAMAHPDVRYAISERAKQRTGVRNSFFGRQHTTDTKEKISKANLGRLRGERGSNWQGGKTRFASLIRNSGPAIRWRRAVLERDSFTCQVCGKVGGPLHADHIRPFALLLDEYKVTNLDDALGCAPLWELSNGRTLCVPCHRKTDSYAGACQKNYLHRKTR